MGTEPRDHPDAADHQVAARAHHAASSTTRGSSTRAPTRCSLSGRSPPGRVATFEIPESLVASYSAIDVSLEADDGDPAHSVTSVLRATYADPAKTPS